jgi:hypothetical protein
MTSGFDSKGEIGEVMYSLTLLHVYSRFLDRTSHTSSSCFPHLSVRLLFFSGILRFSPSHIRLVLTCGLFQVTLGDTTSHDSGKLFYNFQKDILTTTMLDHER